MRLTLEKLYCSTVSIFVVRIIRLSYRSSSVLAKRGMGLVRPHVKERLSLTE